MSDKEIKETGANKNKSKEVATTNTKTVSKKAPKMISAKKLPSIFKKKYTAKAFEKKILRKIYIDADKELVKSIFTEKIQKGKKEFLTIDISRQLTKGDVAQLKEIAKAVKKNRGRIKIIPLIAVAAFITALIIVITTFKNPISKKIIKSGCESVFGAKTDINSVNVELMGISIRVNGIAIGDKNSDNYMKNLFEAQNITIDMNFTQALRGKAIINDVSITGMKFGTERTTSCYIPVTKTEKKAQEESAFSKELKTKSSKAIDDLKSQAANMLGGSNVDEIVGNIQSQLKTPEAAKKAQEDVQNLVTKWQSKPAELKSQVDNFSESVRDIRDFNVNSIKAGTPVERIAKLKEYLETINSAIKQGNEMKSSFEKVTNDVKKDSKAAQNIATDMAKAIESDKNLAAGMLNSAVDTVKNSKQLLTNALNTVGYDMLGKYYPYVQQGIAYAMQMKANSKADEDAQAKEKKNKEKEKAATTVKRLKGTTLWYSREYPGLWIKNVSASGYTENDGSKGFSGAIKNITSNQNLTNIPTTAEAKFDVGSVNHSGKITLDVRKSSNADLIAMNYKGVGFKANVDGEKISSASGIPSINGTASITLAGSAGENGFSAKGEVGLNPVALTSDGFSNEMVTKYYKQALSSITNLSLGYEVSYRDNSGINLGLTGNFAEQFANALKIALESAMNDAKEAAIKKLNEQLNSSNNAVVEKVKEFMGIEGDIDVQNMNLNMIRDSLEAKKKEIEAQISGKIDETKEKAQQAADKAKAEAEARAKEEAEKAKAKATDSIKSGASNLLKGLKK